MFVAGDRRERLRSNFSGVIPGVVLDPSLDHQLLELSDRFGRIQPLWTCLGAIQDRMAAIKPEGIFEIVEAFTCGLITGINYPAIGLEQYRRS